MTLLDRDETWRAIKPFVAGLIDDKIADVAATSGVGVTAHDLGGSRHTGTLTNSQAPQFLLRDGSRSLTGNLAVGSSITIDGVDIDVFKSAYDSHVANPDAHHLRFTSIPGDTGTAIPTAGGALTIAGGNGIGSVGSGNTLTLNLDTPTTLSVSTTNATTTGHTHAITSSSAPGAAASLLASDASGQLTLTGALTDLTSVVVRQGADTQPRLGMFTDSSLRFGPGGSTAPDMVLRRSAANTLIMDDNGLGGAVDLNVSRTISAGSVTTGSAMLNSTNPGGTHLRLAYDGSNYANFSMDNGGSLTVQPTGDWIFDPIGNDILPQTNYDLNLGLINKKYLTLHAAELWVETLVAQDTIATIGGRILVGPTTQLSVDVSASVGGGTITQVGSATVGTVVGGTSCTVNVPSGVSNGHVLIAATHHYGPLTVTAPAGWTQIVQQSTANNETLTVYRRVASSEPASYTWTQSAADDMIVGMVAYNNVDTATIVSASGSQANASSTSMVAPSISPPDTNTMLIFAGVVDPSGGSVSAVTGTPGGSLVEQIDQAASAYKRLYVATELITASGATGTRTVTLSSARVTATALIALKPAPSSTIQVKHNQMRSGDVVYLEANGKIEFMSVASGPTGSGPYTYTVNRNLDGTGPNAWNAGDAVFNTGQSGSGFLDLYSLSGINGVPLEYIYVYDASPTSFSANLANESSFALFPTTGAVGDAIYYGVVNTTWNNLYAYITTAASIVGGIRFEYWNGSAWTTFTPTQAGALTSTGAYTNEWTIASLTGWVPTTINGVSAYWVRQYIFQVTSWTTSPAQGNRRMYWKRRTYGPTIVGNVRNSATYNDWSEHWAIGNLNGLYDYSGDTYGAAFGKYTGAGGTTPWVSADATNGFRVMRGSTKLAQWDTAGAITIGQVAASQGNLYLSSGGIQTRTNTVVKLDAQSDGDVFIGTNTGAASTTFFSLFANAQTYNSESMASGNVLIGDNSASKANILWTPANGRMSFRGGTTTQLYLDTTGTLVAGGGAVLLDSSGMRVQSATTGGVNSPVATNSIQFVTTASSTVDAYFGSTNNISASPFPQQDTALVATGNYIKTISTSARNYLTLQANSVNGGVTPLMRLRGGSAAEGAIVECIIDTGVFEIAQGQIRLANGSGNTSFELGGGGTGNRNAFIDLVGDATYTDYGLRLIRGSGGANASGQLANRGTGELALIAQDAGSVAFYTNSTSRMSISGAGAIGFFGSGGTTRPTVTGSRGGNAALASLLTALANLGLITDSSSA